MIIIFAVLIATIILLFGDEILGIDLPTTVELVVTETEPGVKGDTAQGATKAATVETGYTFVVFIPTIF